MEIFKPKILANSNTNFFVTYFYSVRGRKDQEGGVSCLMWSCIIDILHQILLGHKIKKDEMGWACSTYGRDEKTHNVLFGKSEGRKPLGRPRGR
jgi:hypothetical protein